MEYFATSHRIYLVENEYIKNIPWHDMEYPLIFLPTHKSTYSPISVIDVFTCQLLSDGPPFDFAILCFKKFGAPFQHCLL